MVRNWGKKAKRYNAIARNWPNWLGGYSMRRSMFPSDKKPVRVDKGVRVLYDYVWGYHKPHFQFGENIVLWEDCALGGNIKIGDNSHIGSRAALWGVGELDPMIEIGEGGMISPETIIMARGHEFSDPGKSVMLQGPKNPKKSIKIEKNAWIALRCIIFPEVTIGEGAIIGAGSVVTKDIPPYAIAAGVPAKVIKWRKEKEER